MGTRYAGFPSAVIYKAKTLEEACQHLLWGDEVEVESDDGTVAKVVGRKVAGYMRSSDLETYGCLQITFVDIGQGDGAFLTLPDGKHMLIDAGEGDNMKRFLRWRFDNFQKPIAFEAAVISHSDQDHYGGFDDLFDENITIATLYHNGIVERAGTNSLGAKSATSPSLVTELVPTRTELDKLLKNTAAVKGKKYPALLAKGLKNKVLSKVQSLSVRDQHLPGYGPGEVVQIEVLGPVVETVDGETGLRWLGDAGKTKNGHSVVLRMTYGGVRILLGGDLNIPSENLLMGHHTGMPVPARSAAEHQALVAAARGKLQVDIAKACHHGSADVSLDFLQALNPLATVISSGDDEPHAHPRAEALGSIGACSRGPRPLIFSTELARSTRETIKHPYVMKQRLYELDALRSTTIDAKAKAKLDKEYKALIDSIDRSVAVFGAINLRTDGKRVVMGYKIEAPTRQDKKWDLYTLVPDATGELRYESKFDDE